MANEKDLKQELQEQVDKKAVDVVQKEVDKELQKKAKNLTVTELRKKNRSLNAQTEHDIHVKVPVGVDEEGKNLYDLELYKIKIDNVFRKTKQHRLMEDLIEFMNEGSDRLEILDLATPYISLLMIKHFTSLEVPNNIDDAIDVMNALVDLDIFTKIIELMPEDEVLGMYESISASVDRMNHNIEEMVEEAKKLADKVENEETKELLEDGTEE